MCIASLVMGVCHVPLLVPIASTSQVDATPRVGRLVEELRARLEFPDSASLRSVTRWRYPSFTSATAETAREHFARTYDSCAFSDDPGLAESLVVLRRVRPGVEGGEPACLINAAQPADESEVFEEIRYAGGRFVIEAQTVILSGEHQGRRFTWDLVDDSGWTKWHSSGGEPSVVTRWPLPEASAGAGIFRFPSIPGGLGWIRDNATAVREILRLGFEQGGTLEQDGELRVEVDIRRLEDFNRLDRRSLPSGSGVMETPGFIDLWYRPSSGAAAMRIEWKDCEGWPIFVRDVAWSDRGVWPRTYHDQYFVVGTRAIWRSVSGDMGLDGEGAVVPEEIVWKPLSGQRVEDVRYGPVVTYRVGANGELPSESKIAMMAEGEVRRDHASDAVDSLPEVSLEDAAHDDVPVDAAGGAAPGLTSPWRSWLRGITILSGCALLGIGCRVAWLRRRVGPCE